MPLPKRVLVVYDFDEDDTVPAVRELAAAVPGVELVQEHDRPGRAQRRSARGSRRRRADVVIVTMADLSDDVAVVPTMVRLIRDEGYDIVCASRYMSGGRQIGGPGSRSSCRGSAGVIAATGSRGLPTHDATNAFRAYRRRPAASPRSRARAGLSTRWRSPPRRTRRPRVTEVPSTWRDRSAGQSRFSLLTWLPHYLKWYVYALSRGRVRTGTGPGHDWK